MKNQINKVNVEKASVNSKANSLIALDVLKSVKEKNQGLFLKRFKLLEFELQFMNNPILRQSPKVKGFHETITPKGFRSMTHEL